jgi:alginate O-acetyltransferase complex protein AlgI
VIFSQLEFVIFLAAVFAFLLCVRNLRAQHIFLIVASIYFYAYWDWRFALFLALSTYADYVLAKCIEDTDVEVHRRGWLVLTIILNVSVLFYFKYCNFFITSAAVLLEPLGWKTNTLNVLLPAGISFWTFQKLCYTIDVYRKQLKACRKLTDYALYAFFFPQLVAGPIVRASDFLPQLTSARPITWARVREGFQLFVFGFFKKVFIADNVAAYVDSCFQNVPVLSGASLWLAAICYAIQIYCDFSGYSDMAIGVARAIGYDFKRNFDLPYVSRSITEFWRRWHISLSTWLRDYLYIPLGGNRLGRRRTYINLMLTMLLGGLWHGASWTFVFWGGLHGVALAVHKRWMEWRGKDPRRETGGGVGAFFGWLLTMVVVLVGWVLFRAGSFGAATTMLGRMFTWASGVHYLHPFAFVAVGMMLVPHLLHSFGLNRLAELRMRGSLAAPVLLFMLGLAIVFYPTGFRPFIYFQF